MQIPAPSPVIVGVNGTATGLAAVRLGAREAVARGRPLRIVHAFTWTNPETDDYKDSRRTATELVGDAVATAKRSTPGVRVTGQIVDGPADRVLTQLSRTAELIVLADDDLGSAPWMPLTSVLVRTVAGAFCPVVVARGMRPPSGPVLVAVDGSRWSVQALRHAAGEAERFGAALEVAYAKESDSESQGRAVLDAVLAGAGVGATTRLLDGPAGAALVRASGRARMIVAAARGRHGASVLGSVAREILHRSACPAVFVHGTPVPVQRLPRRTGKPPKSLNLAPGVPN